MRFGSVALALSFQLPPRNAAASQADDIKSVEHRELTIGKTERNDIGGYAIDAGHHNALADPHKLMDRRITPEEGVASDAHMTAKRNVLGETPKLPAERQNSADQNNRPGEPVTSSVV